MGKPLSRVQQVVLDELKARGSFEIPGWPGRSWAYRGRAMLIFGGLENPGKSTFTALEKRGLIKITVQKPGAVIQIGRDLHFDQTAIVQRTRCFLCNGTGEVCQVCGEAEAACECRGGFAGYECGDCGGTGR
jgi:hypothetical protein